MYNKPLLSVVVPIYNVEEFILESLISMSKQTYENIEYILVNDGSTDSSEKIIKNFIKQDERFKLYTTKNAGVSSARNFGISIAKGSYIGFMDPDDLIDSKMYFKLINLATRTKSEIASCGYIKMNIEGNVKVYPVMNNDKHEIIIKNNEKNIRQRMNLISSLIGVSNEEIYKALNNERITFFEGMVWKNIYETKLIKSNNIFFDEKLNYKEDEIFNLECFLSATKISVINECLYFYRVRNESLTTKYKEDLFDLEVNIMELKKELIKKYFSNDKILYLNNVIENKFLIDFIGVVNNVHKEKKIRNRSSKLYVYQELKKYCSNFVVSKSKVKIYFSLKNLNVFTKTLYLYLAKNKKPFILWIVSYLISLNNKKVNI